MRCALIKSFGDPAEVLELDERPSPEPGPGQVRVAMVQSPIHNHDLSTIRGHYGIKPPLPAIPGTEATGVIDALGPGVEGPPVGTRVSVAGVSGAWAEHFLAHAAALVPVPPGLSDDIACQLLAMPLSAAMLLEDLHLPPDSSAWIIQNAANGAVGRVVNVLARERGLRVVNLVRSRAAQAELEAAGVDAVLSSEDPQWPKRVPELTGGAPVLRAVDSIGGKATNQLIQVLGEGGMLISFGAMSGEPLVLDPGLLVFKQATLKGFWATRRVAPPGETRRLIETLVRMAMAGTLPLRVEGRFTLEEAARAAAAAGKGGRTGKVVLRAR